MFVQGWLAGRAIRAALDAGALDPEEIATELEKTRAGGRYLQRHGFLAHDAGVELRVQTVRRGKAVAAQ